MKRATEITLAEVVAVTLLTAVTASLAFPAVSAAVDRTRKARSLDNVRQLASAIRRYAQDYDGAFPGWMNNAPPGADPMYAHNCWDEQIRPYVRSDDVYSNGGIGIKSSGQPNPHARVLSYGLNGCLIAPYSAGGAAFGVFNASNPPGPFRASAIPTPAQTIMLAELSTMRQATVAPYNALADPRPITASGGAGDSSARYNAAWDGWVDISPAPMINLTRTDHDFQTPFANAADWGVARNLYDGGGCYAFCDGHVQFMRLSQSVGLGQSVGCEIVRRTTWTSALNYHNLWNPWRRNADNP